MSKTRILVTGGGAICGAGHTPDAIHAALLEGRSALGPITQWDASGWPVGIAAEVPDYNAGKLTGDRKLLKHIRRGDVFGLYAADQAIEQAGFSAWREALDAAAAERFADGTGVFVGSGGGTFGNQYDYCPLIAAAKGELKGFGQELAATVNPLWLLRSLPNNVLGHVGIRQGLKGPNACITHHSISGLLALAEATAALRERAPELQMDGEMHGDAALSEDIRQMFEPDSTLSGEANILVMPNIDAANISYSLLKMTVGEGITIGPILLGAARPVHVLTNTATVRRIVNMTALAVVDAAGK